jgi:hypothetical protein
MARVAPRVPELAEILCSKCGYVLSGLPKTGNCPECGRPIADSLDTQRTPPLWESAVPGHKAKAFIQTSVSLIRRPARFYRTFTVRGPVATARRFAQWHWWMSAGIFGIVGATHGVWYSYSVAGTPNQMFGSSSFLFIALFLGLTLIVYVFFDGITRLAAWLTTLEATYRGLRLPYEIVLRGMYYHAAHYLPVSIAALFVVVGYQLLWLCSHPWFAVYTWVQEKTPTAYLIVLCVQVVISALYLFQTYWIGMRNMMFANR